MDEKQFVFFAILHIQEENGDQHRGKLYSTEVLQTQDLMDMALHHIQEKMLNPHTCRISCIICKSKQTADHVFENIKDFPFMKDVQRVQLH